MVCSEWWLVPHLFLASSSLVFHHALPRFVINVRHSFYRMLATRFTGRLVMPLSLAALQPLPRCPSNQPHFHHRSFWPSGGFLWSLSCASVLCFIDDDVLYFRLIVSVWLMICPSGIPYAISSLVCGVVLECLFFIF